MCFPDLPCYLSTFCTELNFAIQDSGSTASQPKIFCCVKDCWYPSSYLSPSRSPSPPSSSLPSAQCTEFCQVKRDLANPRLSKPWHKFRGGYRLWRRSSSKRQNPLPSPPHCTWDKLKLRSCWKAVMWEFFQLESIFMTIFTLKRFGREHIQNLKPS